MSDPPALAALQQSILFQGLAPAALASIAAAARPRSVRAGAYFFFQDAPAVRLYVLVAGRVKFTQVTPAGQQVLLRVAGPGDVFGAVAALGDAVYVASAQALGPASALGWESPAIAGFLETYPRLALNAVRFLAGRLQEFQDRYRELATEHAEQRIARTVLRLAGQFGRPGPTGLLLDLPLTRQDIAELAGTTLFTASRVLRRWETAGWVTSGRARVTVRRPEALQQLADAAADPLPEPNQAPGWLR